ncbi:MAG: DUF2235 domain-containing protein [Pseudomonadota bacterium]
MTRIVVLCDGTWNSPDMKDTTHVHALSELLASDDDQVVKYFSGVGVNDPKEEGGTFVGRGINRILGGATGFGLGKKVREAYKFIADTYKDGDEIYLFGFSRGAYTARSVAGMIRKCGIIKKTNAWALRRAFNLYRKTGEHNAPDRIVIRDARARMSPDFATSKKDQETRKKPNVPIVNVAYVGVWDTVGAKGIPTPLFGVFATLYNRRYAFHDNELSSLVQGARHAVAIDERRVFYVPSLWRNLPTLNQNLPGEAYQQKWFVGDHGVVGGSVETDPVSCFTLKWVAEGAERLTYKPGTSLDHIGADALADLDRLNNPSKIYQLAGNLLQWRQGIEADIDTDPNARARVRGREDYRPQSLNKVLPNWLQN